MDLKSAGARWAILYEGWAYADVKARKLELRNTRLFVECAAGHGPGPSKGDLDRADELRRTADAARILVDDHVRSLFP